MRYFELVDQYVRSSGLSLSVIAKKMTEEKGIKIDRSYISMLKNNGTKYPASEEINQALAEVTGGDPDKLILVGYLERAPDSVKKIIENVSGFHEFMNSERDNSQLRFLQAEVKRLQSIIDKIKGLVKESEKE